MIGRCLPALIAVFLGLVLSGNGEPPPTRAQVWIYWGGGATRDWSGRMLLPAGSSVVWLHDFEWGDALETFGGLELPEQEVPVGLGGSVVEGEETGTEGGPGFSLATTTGGEADGIVLEVEAPLGRTIDIELGELRESLPLGAWLAGPRLFELSDGSSVLVGGRDLASARPAVAGRHRVSLHTHSGFSSNRAPLGEIVASLEPWVEHVWWTDHGAFLTPYVPGGDFDRPEALEHWMVSGDRGAARLGAGVDGEGGGLRLDLRPSSPRARSVSARVEPAAGLYAVGMHTSAEPRLRWSWRPPATPRAAAFVEVAWRGGARVRYVSNERAAKRSTDVVLEAPPGEWQAVERLVAGDRWWADEASDDRIYTIRLGIWSAGEAATAGFDAVELESSIAVPYLRLREEVLAASALQEHFGSEESVILSDGRFGPRMPHLTILLPGSLATLAPASTTWQGTDGESLRLLAEAVHAVGGVVAAHHLGQDRPYRRFLEREGMEVDLFEIGAAWPISTFYGTAAERRARDACGYPELGEDEVFPLLVRWDRTTARGLLLTGYGAADLNGRFDRATNGFFDRWLTWIDSEDERPEALLRALRSGRAVGSEWRSRVWIDLSTAGGLPVGKLLATDRNGLRLEAGIEDAVPGSEVRWVVTDFAGDRGEDPPPARRVGTEELTGESGVARLDLDVGATGSFARLEIREPTGHLVAFSNPIHAVPFWPERWPFGRVAFDWRGVRLLGEERLLLDDARLEGGRLRLSGQAFEESGELRLGSSETAISTISMLAGHARAALFEDGREAVIAVPAGERFELSVEFERPIDDPPVRSLLVIPRRKQVYASIDVGDPRSEAGRIGEGFAPPERGGLGQVRRLDRRSAGFEIAVPPGEPYWIELDVGPGRHPEGRLLLGEAVIGRFDRLDRLVFAVDGALATDRPPVERFTIRLDEPPLEAGRGLAVDRISIYRGEGVIDY